MNVIGVDLSLTGTGICTADRAWKVELTAAGIGRLNDIWLEIWDQVKVADETLIVLEGYSYGSQGRAMLDIAELGGHIRYNLWFHDIPHAIVPPAVLKKFATGKGNASKDLMVHTAAKLGCEAHDNNAVDAWFLRQMGLYQQPRNPGIPITDYRTKAVAVVAWPEL